jgi:hypothetical protein
MAHCGNVPWHDHEPQVRVTRCRGGEGIEIKLLLGSLRAAGEEDENVVAEARERPQSRHLRGQSIPFTPSNFIEPVTTRSQPPGGENEAKRILLRPRVMRPLASRVTESRSSAKFGRAHYRSKCSNSRTSASASSS